MNYEGKVSGDRIHPPSPRPSPPGEGESSPVVEAADGSSGREVHGKRPVPMGTAHGPGTGKEASPCGKRIRPPSLGCGATSPPSPRPSPPGEGESPSVAESADGSSGREVYGKGKRTGWKPVPPCGRPELSPLPRFHPWWRTQVHRNSPWEGRGEGNVGHPFFPLASAAPPRHASTMEIQRNAIEIISITLGIVP